MADGNWNDPSIWLGGVVPTEGVEAIVRNMVTVTADADCYSLDVQFPSGYLTVNPGVHLNITH